MSTPTDKDFSTVRAAFALKGHGLIRGEATPDGAHDFIVICWNWTRYCKNWREVLALRDKIGGRA
jgi:hypothetical protein